MAANKIARKHVLSVLALISATLMLVLIGSIRSRIAQATTDAAAKPFREDYGGEDYGSDDAVQLANDTPEAGSAEPAGGNAIEEPGSTIWLPILTNEYGPGTFTQIPLATALTPMPKPPTPTRTPLPTAPAFSTCFDGAGPVFTIRGEQTARYKRVGSPLPVNAIVDARTAVWPHVVDYPVVLEGGPDVCFSGGTIWGEYPYSTDWETMHDTSAFTFRTNGHSRVENIRVHNYGDGISFSRGITSYSFHVKGAHMTHIRDDCVQNDYMLSGWIEDSLFDGCYTAFSAQSQSLSEANDGSQNIWTIENSLIRLEPMEKVYNDEGLIPGHGAFFKWNRDDNKSPQLSLHNNIFRVDQPSNSNSGLGTPPGKLVSCSNNIVVWLGEGDYPDPLPETFDGRPCFTVTTDPTVWDEAVQDWMNRH